MPVQQLFPTKRGEARREGRKEEGRRERRGGKEDRKTTVLFDQDPVNSQALGKSSCLVHEACTRVMQGTLGNWAQLEDKLDTG